MKKSERAMKKKIVSIVIQSPTEKHQFLSDFSIEHVIFNHDNVFQCTIFSLFIQIETIEIRYYQFIPSFSEIFGEY